MPAARTSVQNQGAIPPGNGQVEPQGGSAPPSEPVAATGAGARSAGSGLSVFASHSHPRTFDEATCCGARRKGDPAHRCLNPRGFRTEHVGFGNCYLHGGRSTNGAIRAERERAAAIRVQVEAQLRELAKSGNVLSELVIDDVDPLDSLMEALRVASWRESGLRMMLQARLTLHGVNHLGDQAEDIVSTMHREAIEQRAKIAKLCLDAGIDERMVKIAERQAEVVVRAVAAGLKAAGITDPALREAAQAAVVEQLKARPPVGAELN
jgi:hypothetical protein